LWCGAADQPSILHWLRLSSSWLPSTSCGQEEEGSKLLSVEPRDRTRGDGHRWRWGTLHLNIRNHFFEGCQALEHIPQPGRGVSIHGDAGNRLDPALHSPLPPSLPEQQRWAG